MNQRILAGAVILGVIALVLTPLAAFAYETYADTGSGGCVNCHLSFQGRGALHDLHVGGSQMTNNCNLCHYTGFGSPHTDASAADANHGCNGCHMGEGLRLAHATDHGITVCSSCHSGDGTPPPETTLPAYYSRSDVNLTQPCAIGKNNGGEDYNGDRKGLDNDGDGFYDYNDTDCAGVETTQPSWGVIKSGYGNP
jgi:hypothetical protein